MDSWTINYCSNVLEPCRWLGSVLMQLYGCRIVASNPLHWEARCPGSGKMLEVCDWSHAVIQCGRLRMQRGTRRVCGVCPLRDILREDFSDSNVHIHEHIEVRMFPYVSKEERSN